MVELTVEEARRIALNAQGFAVARPAKPGPAALRKLIDRIHVLQLDPINVVVRAHYMPAFSRLGAYDVAALDRLVYGQHAMFEYIGHAWSLVAISHYPCTRWRMDQHASNPRWTPQFLHEALAEVRDRGALTPSDLTFQRRYEKVPGRWGGSYGKSAMRQLAWEGKVVVAGRRGIEQVYDLPERVLPAAVLAAPAADAQAGEEELLLASAKALGVATATDLGDYWTMRNVGPAIKRLVAGGRLLEATVKGWTKKAFLHPEAAKTRSVSTAALVSPFDSLIWTRDRVNRLFGFDYTIEIYVPAPKRRYGYYVYPFLMDEELVARVDLKADRKGSTLVVQGAFAEPTAAPTQVAPVLAGELHTMAAWLGLGRVEVKRNGDLAAALRKAA
jgi:uncharacterized protein